MDGLRTTASALESRETGQIPDATSGDLAPQGSGPLVQLTSEAPADESGGAGASELPPSLGDAPPSVGPRHPSATLDTGSPESPLLLVGLGAVGTLFLVGLITVRALIRKRIGVR
jgi:hypothetical protein